MKTYLSLIVLAFVLLSGVYFIRQNQVSEPYAYFLENEQELTESRWFQFIRRGVETDITTEKNQPICNSTLSNKETIKKPNALETPVKIQGVSYLSAGASRAAKALVVKSVISITN